MKKLIESAAIVLFALPLAACAGVDIEHIDSAGSDFDTVNGSVRIGAHSTVGDLETVNGSITLGDDGRADDLETVNGSINLGDQCRIDSAETVNGRIVAGAALQVKSGLETVNGTIKLDPGAQVGEDVETVNGDIQLDHSKVSGAVILVSGTVDTGAASDIGSIHVREQHGFSLSGKRKPLVIVGPKTVVGTIRFDRDGELRIHRSAKVGKISGVKPTYFD